MNKFKLTSTKRPSPTGVYKILYTQANCVVCKESFTGSDGILYRHVVEFGEYGYIIPDWHRGCREIFQLNPLAYE